MAAGVQQVHARRAVRVEAELGKFVGKQAMVQRDRLDRLVRGAAIKLAEQGGRAAQPGQRRFQPLHTPPLLIDEHQRTLVVASLAQAVVQASDLVRVLDIAGEQDEAPGPHVAIQRPLLGRELQAGTAQDAGRAHRGEVLSP